MVGPTTFPGSLMPWPELGCAGPTGQAVAQPWLPVGCTQGTSMWQHRCRCWGCRLPLGLVSFQNETRKEAGGHGGSLSVNPGSGGGDLVEKNFSH